MDATPDMPNDAPPPRWKRYLPVIAIAALAVTLVASGAYREVNLETLSRHYDSLAAWIAANPVLSRVAFAGALAAMVGSGLPGGVVLTVASGLLFGTIEGGVLCAIGNVTGATALYLAARYFFRHGGKPPAIVEKIRDGFQANPASYAFFIRLVPIFPFGAASIALAWLGCRLPLFLLSSGLGSLPGAMIYASLGAGLAATIREHHDVELSILAQPRFAIPLSLLAVLALLPAVVGVIRRRRAATAGPVST